MMQRDIMMESEGDAWFERNRDKMGMRDPVFSIMQEVLLAPTSILEIGCANGWRLNTLRAAYNCSVMGVDPSQQAASEAAELHRVPIYQGTAEALALPNATFDLVIYGFCLYLTDPADWLKIAAEGDRVLKPGGRIIIHDFAEPSHPFARRYEHRTDMLSYHFDFARLWHAHPLYSVTARRVWWEDEMVTVLTKRSHETFEVME